MLLYSVTPYYFMKTINSYVHVYTLVYSPIRCSKMYHLLHCTEYTKEKVDKGTISLSL